MKKLFPLLVLALSATALNAAPVSITRTKMAELFISLKSIGPGLTPQNTGIAADDINALEKPVDARDKAITEAQRQSLGIDKADPDFAGKQRKIQESFDLFSEQEVSLELTPLILTDNEIRDARVAPNTLALIRKYLCTPEAKK